jgi:hypothetical protein
MSKADEIIRGILAERDARQAESGEVPLYARPHEVIGPASHGKCEACGQYPDDSIHAVHA